jgi:hypothetical protein
MFGVIEAAAYSAQKERQVSAQFRCLNAWFVIVPGVGIEYLADPRETRHNLCTFSGASPPPLDVWLGPKPASGAQH